MSLPTIPLSQIFTILASAIFLRTLVGYQPHSGQDNYHGSIRAYGGDYEAQRHWMELTLHLNIGDWYYYDLEYWGLDYPPLTAYVSYICGVMSEVLVGRESMALELSRGYEDATHKAYMRATVLVLDVLICMPAFWAVARSLYGDDSVSKKFLWAVVFALMQPAIILIDHGHFQYNTVSLGLALWAAYFMTKDAFSGCIYGSVFFCLALNFKQMCLYYAPAVFCYLLGRCWRDRSAARFVGRFCGLGVTVVATFAMLWWPFLFFGPSDRDTTITNRLVQVLHRIFPFQRGLFEGKVSNLWCALSVKPFSIRERIDAELQPLIALGVTAMLMLPACIQLFRIGQSLGSNKKDLKMLLWGMTSTALAFFLASFQVHEKSILLALAPLILLLWDDFIFVQWFAIAATGTLWPLLCVDRLQVAYVCIMLMYVSLVWICCDDKELIQVETNASTRFALMKLVIVLSTLAMVLLHVGEMVFTPPLDLRDLFPVLWSIVGCGIFCISWLVTCWHFYQKDDTRSKLKVS